MDSVLNKMMGIKNKNSHSRRDNRYYNDGYEVRCKKTSSTTSSRSDDDNGDYDAEKNGSTIEKVEYFVNQMFQSCAVNMQGMFNDPSSPRRSSEEDFRRLKGGSGYNGTSPGYDVLRASKSGLVSQRKRGTRSSSRRRRGMSRARQRNRVPDDTPLPGNNKMMLYVHDDDDEVSALSAGTLEEMATRQQRLIMLQEANRKGAVARRAHSYPLNNYNTTNLQSSGEHLGSIHAEEFQNIMEDSKSFYSVSSANTTVFEGIWNKTPLPLATSTRERDSIYEERESILEDGGLDINCKPIAEALESGSTFKSNIQTQSERDTALSRKWKRHQEKSGTPFQAIDEDTSQAFSLQPDEQEI